MGKWVPVDERLPGDDEWDYGVPKWWYVTRSDGSVDQDRHILDKDVIAWYEEDPPAPYIPPPKPKPGPMSLAEAVAEARRCGLEHVWYDDGSYGISYKIDEAVVSLYRAAIGRWHAGEH